MRIFILFGLVIFLTSSALCQDDKKTTVTTETTPSTTTPTTTDTTKSSTTTETTTDTSTPTETTTDTTSTTTTTTTTTTTETTTTTTSTTTTVSTTTEPASTTTTVPDVDKVFNFTVPNNSSVPPCLRAKFSLTFEIEYPGERNNTKMNLTLTKKLEDYNDYYGLCNDTFNSLSVRFNNDWVLFMNYTLKNSAFELDTLRLDYTVDSLTFPDVQKDYLGKKSVEASNLNEFTANKGNSFKCTSKTTLSLNDTVQLEFRNYQAQAFISSDSKSPDFDTAIECAADTSGTSKLIPIIVGSVLALLVVLVLVAYIIGRRKHRPGYQQV